MLTILLDSNIFDKFLEHPELQNKALDCKDSGLIRIIHTSIQRYENEELQEPKRTALRELRESLSE